MSNTNSNKFNKEQNRFILALNLAQLALVLLSILVAVFSRNDYTANPIIILGSIHFMLIHFLAILIGAVIGIKTTVRYYWARSNKQDVYYANVFMKNGKSFLLLTKKFVSLEEMQVFFIDSRKTTGENVSYVLAYKHNFDGLKYVARLESLFNFKAEYPVLSYAR